LGAAAVRTGLREADGPTVLNKLLTLGKTEGN
jgi:hypothetical protein